MQQACSSATPRFWSTDQAESVASAAVHGCDVEDPACTSPYSDDAVVLITQVDIGDGRQIAIRLRKSHLGRTHELACSFCVRHKLPSEAIAPLGQHLALQLASAAQVRALWQAELQQRSPALQMLHEGPSHCMNGGQMAGCILSICGVHAALCRCRAHSCRRQLHLP